MHEQAATTETWALAFSPVQTEGELLLAVAGGPRGAVVLWSIRGEEETATFKAEMAMPAVGGGGSGFNFGSSVWSGLAAEARPPNAPWPCMGHHEQGSRADSVMYLQSWERPGPTPLPPYPHSGSGREAASRALCSQRGLLFRRDTAGLWCDGRICRGL